MPWHNNGDYMIYKLHISSMEDASEGYEYFGSMAAAKRRRAELVREGYDRANLDISCSPTPKSKRQVLSLLNLWASHPDNG